jgi:hypothetical protein
MLRRAPTRPSLPHVAAGFSLRRTTPDDDPQASSTFKVPNADGKGWTNVQSPAGFPGDYTIHAQDASPSKSNFAEWKLVATSATPELFATWVALPGNATNATYQIFQNLPKGSDNPLLLTVVVDQTRSPNDALLFGTTLAESLGSVTLTNWVPGTTLFIRLLTLGANGNVVADAVFDPPTRHVAQRSSAESGTAIPNGSNTSPGRREVGIDSALAEAIADVFVTNPSPVIEDSTGTLARGSEDSGVPSPGNQEEMNHSGLLKVRGQKGHYGAMPSATTRDQSGCREARERLSEERLSIGKREPLGLTQELLPRRGVERGTQAGLILFCESHRAGVEVGEQLRELCGSGPGLRWDDSRSGIGSRCPHGESVTEPGQ